MEKLTIGLEKMFRFDILRELPQGRDLEAYIVHGRKYFGSSVRAIVEGDLMMAVLKWQNEDFKGNVIDTVNYLNMYAPSGCFGSKDAVENWKGILAESQAVSDDISQAVSQDSKGSICDEDTSVSRKIFKGTREEYLMAGKKELSKLFKQAGHTVPKDVKVTMSLPTKNARPSKVQTIGQCFSRSASDGGINEILITPLLNNSISVLETLTHELVHAIDDCQHGHKAPFKRIAEAVGLEGKMTNTIAGEELTEKIKAIVKKLGRYPHKKLNLSGKKQTTRNLPILCTNYDFHGMNGQPQRTTHKMVDNSPLPVEKWFCNGCAEFGFMIPLFANCEGDLIALTEERTVFGTEYTYPANKLARQFAEISGQKTLSAYTISRMERMGVKVMNELEYYKQQAGVENS